MPILEAENSFRKGLVALVEGDPATATSWFASAMRIERERRAHDRQMRYLSYYGLCLALSHKPTRDAIRACEIAARTDSFNPDLELNLGRVYLLAGETGKARAAFERGVCLCPVHAGLQNELARMERDGQTPSRIGHDGTLALLRAALSALSQRLGQTRSST